jgi:hypothetical protein
LLLKYAKNKYIHIQLGVMTKNYQDNLHRKLFLTSISTAILVGFFVIGSQLVQPSMAQDLGQMEEQVQEQLGGVLTGGNQTGNQTDNQTGNQSGGLLGLG